VHDSSGVVRNRIHEQEVKEAKAVEKENLFVPRIAVTIAVIPYDRRPNYRIDRLVSVA
jgi:hypothetical protein